MATTRTVMTPDGDVITFDVADQTVMTPSGAVVNATIEAAAAGGNKYTGALSMMGVGMSLASVSVVIELLMEKLWH